MKTLFFVLVGVLFSGCGSSGDTKIEARISNDEVNVTLEVKSSRAYVRNVSVSANESAYTFTVSVESFDTGCDSFADWWEVLREDGSLAYRRILLHSHVGDQPFTRSGSSVAISQDEILYVRAHMNKDGYGPNQYVGSVANGFKEAKTNLAVNPSVELLEPQNQGCAF